MASFDARPAGNGITRRTMIKTSAVLIGSCALGFTGVTSLGCSADNNGGGASSGESDQVTLHVDGQRFFINGDAAGTAFSGAALSLVPNLADGTIALCYRDGENPDPCCLTLAPLGSPVIVTGTLRMLNVDGVNSDGVIRSLTVRGLVREDGVDEDSRAALLVTSGLFLEHLGLESLDQLPPLAPFLPERETTNVPDGE